MSTGKSTMLRAALAVALAGMLVLAAAPAAALLHAETEPGFPEAVFIEPLPDGQSFGDCSGVVIAPTVVLTAAHCLSGRDFGAPATLAARISVYAGADKVARRVTAMGFVRSPAYLPLVPGWRDSCDCTAALSAAGDWGLLFVDAPLPVAPVRRVDELLPGDLRARLAKTHIGLTSGPASDGRDLALAGDLADWLTATFARDGWIEARVVAFGFAACASEATGRDCTGKGVRRSAVVRIAADPRCGRVGASGPDKPPAAVLCLTAPNGGHVPIALADSGGPIYLRAADGQWFLAGIVSTNSAPAFSGYDAHLAASILAVIDDVLLALDPASPRRPMLPFEAP